MNGQPRRLKLGRVHLIIVGTEWPAVAVTVNACLNYNRIAGREKTPGILPLL